MSKATKGERIEAWDYAGLRLRVHQTSLHDPGQVTTTWVAIHQPSGIQVGVGFDWDPVSLDGYRFRMAKKEAEQLADSVRSLVRWVEDSTRTAALLELIEYADAEEREAAR